MATIESLSISITQMGRQQLYQHLSAIRTRRRLKPEAKKRAPAKVARSASKKNLRQQDLFQYAKGLNTEDKNSLAAELLKQMLQG